MDPIDTAKALIWLRSRLNSRKMVLINVATYEDAVGAAMLAAAVKRTTMYFSL